MGFKRRISGIIILLILVVGASVLSLIAGEYDVSFRGIFGIIYFKLTGTNMGDFSQIHEIIIWRLRLPRVLLAISAGLSLGVAGTAYQGCFRNPLVEPYILGVSSGAAAGAALSMVFPQVFPQGQLTAFLMALAAVFISYSLATVRGQTPSIALVLSGIVIGALFSALVGIMKYLAADSQLREITFWMMGGLYYATWDDVQLNMAVGLPVLAFLIYNGWKLNILTLGDEEAKSLGLNPQISRLVIVIAATLAAAFCVSTCGIIAWVGLMIPHAARLILGPDHRWLVPGSALLGAVYLLVCDTIARTLTSAEIPLGIVTSIIGAPYLVWLLKVRGRAIYGH
ncbi:MAG: iron ABC transporter permease [Deltaproteobacteria bacterium]|jgi:iron complex transport system permease protein|nr:iron ABC transporter permease [Deltaproteobacteria bacterium]